MCSGFPHRTVRTHRARFHGAGHIPECAGLVSVGRRRRSRAGRTEISSGNLDINNYGPPPSLGDPISSSESSTTPSSIAAPGTDGRGTAIIITTDPPATYNLVYYIINSNTALLMGQDKTRVETGIVVLQY